MSNAAARSARARHRRARAEPRRRRSRSKAPANEPRPRVGVGGLERAGEVDGLDVPARQLGREALDPPIERGAPGRARRLRHPRCAPIRGARAVRTKAATARRRAVELLGSFFEKRARSSAEGAKAPCASRSRLKRGLDTAAHSGCTSPRRMARGSSAISTLGRSRSGASSARSRPQRSARTTTGVTRPAQRKRRSPRRTCSGSTRAAIRRSSHGASTSSSTVNEARTITIAAVTTPATITAARIHHHRRRRGVGCESRGIVSSDRRSAHDRPRGSAAAGCGRLRLGRVPRPGGRAPRRPAATRS